jgi:hypothetical protein
LTARRHRGSRWLVSRWARSPQHWLPTGANR